MASSLINSVRTIEAWIKKAAALQRLSDGEGLYLLKPKAGAPGWRLDHSSAGKRNTLGLGTYPATGPRSTSTS